MKTKISMAASMKLAIVIAVMCCVTWASPALSNAEVVGPPRAVVKAFRETLTWLSTATRSRQNWP